MTLTTNSLAASAIKRNVMRRVRTIHALRPLVSNAALALVLFTASVYALGREVWVARVFQNMPSMTNTLAFTQFFLSAFINTRTVVQLVIVVSAFAFVWLARDVGRSLSTGLRFA